MPPQISRARLERLLFDDAPHGDLTTDTLGITDRPGQMRFTAREPMVAALTADAGYILEFAGAKVTLCAEDGQRLDTGAEILRAEGSAGALLRGWKVAQTLIETWAGVATAARSIVEAARRFTRNLYRLHEEERARRQTFRGRRRQGRRRDHASARPFRNDSCLSRASRFSDARIARRSRGADEAGGA